VLVAALAAGVGAGAVLAINPGNPATPAAGQQLPGSGSGGQTGLGSGSDLSNASEQAIINKVEPGLVDITSHLKYTGGTAEATGMVISSSGLVLTNNHVIDGTTGLTATLVDSGRRYAATYVGYDQADDVAVIKLTGASGLTTVPLGNSSTVRLNATVVALGNAEGEGGARAVTGSITGLNRTITASDEGSQTGSETLHGMLQTSAQIVPGDSGGSLVSVRGQVIGMDTAAATGDIGADVGYAIPINKALALAREIISGQSFPGIKTGVTGFLGVLVPGQNSASTATSPKQQRTLQLKANGFGSALGGTQGCLTNELNMGIPGKIAPVASGALVDGVLCGTAAASADISSGDVVVSVDGHAVSSPSSLTTIMEQYRAGTRVTVVWVDPSGSQHTAGLTLTARPPN